MDYKPKKLVFEGTTHMCLEAAAPWDQLRRTASYEVSPLIDGDNEPYAWEANYYVDKRLAYPHSVCLAYPHSVGLKQDEFPSKDDAMIACQEHSDTRVTGMIEEMTE